MVHYENIDSASVKDLLNNYGIEVICLHNDKDIPYSFWGQPEAGRLGATLYVRKDTPIHSVLHEACHFICMSAKQRFIEAVDAKGSAQEENATCYLQIIFADHIHGYCKEQILKDMDAWGYSFRLGSAQDWFTKDAEDTYAWLIDEQILSPLGVPTWCLRK
jgi:hypothetical protein